MRDAIADLRPATWRIVLAVFFDFLICFFLFGFLVALLNGGFQFDGAPALLCFTLIIAYFVVGQRWLGGTLWQRVLRAR